MASSRLDERIAGLTPKQRALLELRRRARAAEGGSGAAEPIAVVGMSCRFPGGAGDPEAYWRLLRDGVDAISEVPADRWNLGAFYDPDPEAAGRMYTRWGGFLEEPLRGFDAGFFGMSPREAEGLDPQQRLVLEVAWEALERAGVVPAELRDSATGVYLGMMTGDYANLRARTQSFREIDVYYNSGTESSFAAGRLSYLLGLQGPSMVVATACSSALVAAHLACQALRGGECDLALAGGVNVLLSPEVTVYSSRIGSMAADGRCKTFDAAADGYVRGEGCGVIVLKRLADAARDGDPILCLLRGSAINHDGPSGGLTVPNPSAQQAVIRKALAAGGVKPAEVSYLEAHGTGTSLGDPIEMRAMWSVLGRNRAEGDPLWVGSAKTNVGHLEAAAGMAGLLKVILALQHREIPPHLHLHEPNPMIPWEEIRAEVPTRPTPWPSSGRRRIAGVSSFGLSGMNAHVVVEEAPPSQDEAAGAADAATAATVTAAPRPFLLPLSAATPEALRQVARRHRDFLAGPGAGIPVGDVCATAALRRQHYDFRLAAAGRSREELIAVLDAAAGEEAHPGLATGRRVPGMERRAVFVFPGQGGQWAGMGLGLAAAEPVFHGALTDCDRAVREVAGWSVLERLEAAAGDGAEPAWEIDTVQPLIFSIQVALAALWRSRGVVPEAVVGHSLGEVAAAHVAGALSLEDAARIICLRSRALRKIAGRGAMAVVELSLEEARQALAGRGELLSVAVSNSPRSTVLSGEPEALDGLLGELEELGVFCRRVKVDVASHSPQVDPLTDELLEVLGGLAPRAAETPFHSTVTAAAAPGQELDAAYWVRNLREPVLFWKTVEGLTAEGCDTFIELSPHPVLLPALEQGLAELPSEGAAVASMRREEDEGVVLLTSLGRLHCLGLPVDWRAVVPAPRSCAALPTYPWQREEHWFAGGEVEVAPDRAGARRRTDGTRDHPLLGRGSYLRLAAGGDVWDLELGLDGLPFLTDHRVAGRVVLPAAATAEMTLAAGRESLGAEEVALEELVLSRPLALPEAGAAAVQVTVVPDGFGGASFLLASPPAGGSGDREAGLEHARGRLAAAGEGTPPTGEAPAEIRARCGEEVAGEELYRAMEARGLAYGRRFQGVERLWRRDGEAVARLRLPEASGAADGYRVHPVLLDACFQLLAACFPEGEATYLPVGLGALRRAGELPEAVWAHATLAPGRREGEASAGDLALLDEAGRRLVEARGLRLEPLATEAGDGAGDRLESWLYGVRWQALEPVAPPAPDPDAGAWLLLVDAGGVGRRLARELSAGGEPVVVAEAGTGFARLDAGGFVLDPADPEDYRRLLREAFPAGGPRCRAAVHLWGLDAGTGAPGEEPGEALLRGPVSALHLVQALARAPWRDSPRLWLVTRDAAAPEGRGDTAGAGQAPLIGLGRTVAQETPELRCARVDLAAENADGAVAALAAELRADREEDELALRSGATFAARLARLPEATAGGAARAPAGERAFHLEIPAPGVLERLTLRAMERRPPGPGEVEIEVEAAGLNFLDVLRALGVGPGQDGGPPPPLGGECAGRVAAVGEGVEGLAPGDPVAAVAAGAFASHVTAPAELVVRRPGGLSPEVAAGVPVVFATAYYALARAGRLAPGERVLIHSAAGGTGLAAVAVARHLGAEVLATAGSEAKRRFLRSLGIEHVMDSRSLDFAGEVMEATGGRGVDAVLNSLSGAAIPAGLSTLAPFGRFLDISKRDVYGGSRLDLSPFRRGLSYVLVDVDGLARQRPGVLGEVIREVMALLARGELAPTPLRVFPIAAAEEAFRRLAQGTTMGKLILSLADREEVAIEGAAPGGVPLRPDGAYVITGGRGGLGLTLARWLVTGGARHLSLLGRSEPSREVRQAVAELEAAGARVLTPRVDVARREELAGALEEARREAGALRGVFHLAAVLDDGILLRQDAERFRRVFGPKALGARHLHDLTREDPLDLFVLFSSSAALVGSPGQGNYAAANAYLDALAHHRRARGLPALSVDWGPFSEVGLAAAQENRGERLSYRGVGSIAPEEGMEILGRLLGRGVAQAGVMPLNLRQWRQSFPQAAGLPLFSGLLDAEAAPEAGAGAPLRRSLEEAAAGERRGLLEEHLREQVAQVLKLPPARVDARTPLTNIGIDSLMALELRNRLEASLGLTLPGTLVWSHPTIERLTEHLAGEMDLSLGGAGGAPGEDPEATAGGDDDEELVRILQEAGRLSEAELAAGASEGGPAQTMSGRGR